MEIFIHVQLYTIMNIEQKIRLLCEYAKKLAVLKHVELTFHGLPLQQICADLNSERRAAALKNTDTRHVMFSAIFFVLCLLR